MLLPLLLQKKEVLLLMHSHGGCPGSAAAAGTSRQEFWLAGKQGGILALMCIAALLTKQGEELYTRKIPSWIARDVRVRLRSSRGHTILQTLSSFASLCRKHVA